MANTLELGNGKWATGKDTVLAYNDLNNNFKPLPFDFSRASSATVVNKAGLIETVGSGEPRIDFLGNTKGALKLEPSRTNSQTYSADFSVWNVSGSTVSSSYGLSPDGSNNSSLITEGTGSAQHRISILSPASSGIYTFSCFVKNKVGNHQAYIDMGAVTGFFDFDTKTMYSAAGTTNVESWSNDWYRISITSSSNITPVASYMGIGKNNTETFQGDGSSAIEFFGAQLEEGYATSYIPTQGSAVTRVAETASGAGNSEVFNDSEGVLFADISALANATNKYINIYQDANNRILLWITSTGVIRGYAIVNSSGSDVFIDAVGVDTTNNNKIALSWQGFTLSLFVNGIKIGNSTVTNSFSTMNLTTLDLKDVTNANFFYGKTKDVRVYNTALTDSELIALTTI